MSFTKIDTVLIIKRETSLVPPWRWPTFFVDTCLADYTKKDTVNNIHKSLLTKCWTLCFSVHKSILMLLTPTQVIIYHDSSISCRLLKHNNIYTAEYIVLFEGVYEAIQLPESINNIYIDPQVFLTISNIIYIPIF